MDRKLTLDLNSLKVTTFEAGDSDGQSGTVKGREDLSAYPGCVPGCNTRLTCSTNLC
ncbi:MAG TPA: hypothetical protein VHG91_14155 [Longimicrobium sp.]|nr:hypothetical protein [Longimicrobium sp.]